MKKNVELQKTKSKDTTHKAVNEEKIRRPYDLWATPHTHQPDIEKWLHKQMQPIPARRPPLPEQEKTILEEKKGHI